MEQTPQDGPGLSRRWHRRGSFRAKLPSCGHDARNAREGAYTPNLGIVTAHVYLALVPKWRIAGWVRSPLIEEVTHSLSLREASEAATKAKETKWRIAGWVCGHPKPSRSKAPGSFRRMKEVTHAQCLRITRNQADIRLRAPKWRVTRRVGFN